MRILAAMLRHCVSVGVIALISGCGSGHGPRDVVVPRHISEGGGAPELSQVTDMGDLESLPARGPLPQLNKDGLFTIGELMLVEGDDFGKQPAVKVDGRPAQILARIGNGGIVSRIPPGVRTGEVEVEVSNASGSDATRIAVHRHAVVVDASRGVVHVVDVDSHGETVATSSFELPGARDVAFSSDGQVAYVAADASKPVLGVVAMAAPGGPRLVRNIEVPSDRAMGVVTTPDSTLVAVVGGNAVTLFDSTDAPFPRFLAEIILPDGARAVAVDPAAKFVAAVASEKNQLTIIDVGQPASPKIADSVSILPGETVPLIRDLAFSPTGDELWVLTGDSRESTVAGSRPTTVVAVKPDPTQFVVSRQVPVAAAGAPLTMAVGHRETVGAATVIRSNRRRGAIVISAANRALVQPDPGLSLAGVSEIGQLLRVDLEGAAAVLAGGRSVVLDAAISHDLNLVVTAGITVRGDDGASADFGIGALPFEGGRATFLRLGSADATRLLAPSAVALAP